jgi:ABC-type multidrug transport system permease subunit
MIWVGWRQQRTETLIAVGILAVLGAMLIPTGITMISAYNHDGLAACLQPSASEPCQQAIGNFTARFEPLSHLIDWFTLVPGIIGVLLSLTMVLITSMAIVRERERGTLEQLIVTPIDKTSLMLGKIVPFLLIGYVQITVILALGRLLFHIPVRGSLLLLYVLSFAFVVASLALGLFLSTLVRSQVQAMQLSFFLILPNILLSGFMFPREAMPAPAQWIGMRCR